MCDNEEQPIRQYSVRIDTKPTPFRWSGKAGGPLEAAAFAFLQAIKDPELYNAMFESTAEYYSVAELDDDGNVRTVFSIKERDAIYAGRKRIRYQRKLLKSAIDDYLS